MLGEVIATDGGENGPLSEHALGSVAFPRLDHAQIESLARCTRAERKRYRDGERFFRVGDRTYHFYVVLSGRIEIVDESNDPPRAVTHHEPGEFTGDVQQLTGRPALVSDIARGSCEVYEISPEGVRQIVNRDPRLGDVILQAFIARRQLLRTADEYVGVRVIGSRYSPDTFRIRDFLCRNRAPFTWFDLESDAQLAELLERFDVTRDQTPVVTWGKDTFLRNPSNRELADALGLRTPFEQTFYDLVVVGAGPAGLAAAVYGASGGLRTLVLERSVPGGQAGASMRIENYLGFPTGISGGELADRAFIQATKFGAKLPVATTVARLSFENDYPVVNLDDGQSVTAKCLIIATGAQYRRLPVEGCERYEGSGVYYAATLPEALACRGVNAVVVGGGNSAGQAAVYLSQLARRVCLVVRDSDLSQHMSGYLVQRIEEISNIEVLLNTEVKRMHGDGTLQRVGVVNHKTGETITIETPALYCFLGAVPHTDWLPPEVERDDENFVLTGPALIEARRWTLKRQPFLLETSCPGVFAAGDVRSGSVKRITSAVGEGAMAVQFVHEFLKEM